MSARESLYRKFVLLAAVLGTLVACNPGADSLQGNPSGKATQAQDSNASPKVASNEKYATGTSVTTSEGNQGSLPAAGAKTDATQSENDKINIPVAITGSYLFCMKDKIDGLKATVYCSVEDKASKRPITIPGKYVTHAFSSAAPAALTVSVLELPAKSYWHAQYTVVGKSSEAVSAGLDAITFSFEGRDFNNALDAMKQKITYDAPRRDLTIRSLKPQTNGVFRCFDYFRMPGDKIVTTPCGARDSSQDWFVTAESKIAHISGACIQFNPSTRLTIEGDCNNSNTPSFDFTGEQIKIRGSAQCVGLINEDLSGVDYVGIVNCNAADITQHWVVSPNIR